MPARRGRPRRGSGPARPAEGRDGDERREHGGDRRDGTAGVQHVSASGGNDTAYLSGVKNSAFDIFEPVSITGATRTPARKYVNAGQYSITLTVTDDLGVKPVLSKTVTVS
jgi:hypothetical protein